MNILFIISSLEYGGAEKQTVLDANMMVMKNEVFLAYFTDGPQKEIIDKRVNIVKIKKKNYLITAINLARLVKQNNIQLIHSSLFAAMIISALCGLFYKVKVIWHFHSHEYELPRVHQLAFKCLAHLSDVKKICFVSQELMQYFNERRFDFPRHKIELLYNNSTIHASFEKNKKNGEIIIGYVGRVVTLKRVEYLLELAQYLVSNKFVDFHILIVGDGEQRYLLEQELSGTELQAYISFEGFQKDVEKYYRNFDLFVNPSQEECLSIALIDAGICGIPSVAFDVGGNDEIIVNSQSGYIVNTKEEFFEKVFSLINDNTLRERMGKKAKGHCLINFSEVVHLQQLESLHKEVIG